MENRLNLSIVLVQLFFFYRYSIKYICVFDVSSMEYFEGRFVKIEQVILRILKREWCRSRGHIYICASSVYIVWK